MPKELERKLRKEARKRGLRGERADAYVYGTLRKTGWKPKRLSHRLGPLGPWRGLKRALLFMEYTHAD